MNGQLYDWLSKSFHSVELLVLHMHLGEALRLSLVGLDPTKRISSPHLE